MGKKEIERLEEQLNPKELYQIRKVVTIQYDGRQYSIRLPIKVVRALDIKTGQTFIIEIDPTRKPPQYSFKLGKKIIPPKKRDKKK